MDSVKLKAKIWISVNLEQILQFEAFWNRKLWKRIILKNVKTIEMRL